jgi:RIO kinase 1
MSTTGPVIIDFPQAVDPASNGAAKRLLARDVDNLQRFLARFVPGRCRPYAEELWALYESGQLTAETRLRGEVEPPRKHVEPPRKHDETQELLARIDAPRRPRPVAAARGRGIEVKIDPPPCRAGRSQQGTPRPAAPKPAVAPPRAKQSRGPGPSPAPKASAAPTTVAAPKPDAPPRKRRRRRRRADEGLVLDLDPRRQRGS